MNRFHLPAILAAALACCSCQLSPPPVVLRPVKAQVPAFKRGYYHGGLDGGKAAPRLAHAKIIAPHYPWELMEAGVDGIAIVAAVVDEKGAVEEAQVCVANDERFGAAARDAMLKWTFPPFTAQGKPVRVAIIKTFVFKIDGKRLRLDPEFLKANLPARQAPLTEGEISRLQ